jgi:hypothetical protein
MPKLLLNFLRELRRDGDAVCVGEPAAFSGVLARDGIETVSASGATR